MTSRYEKIVQANARHYGRLYREHGDTPDAAQWSDTETQDRRLKVLCEIADLSAAKILDFGCGTGRLYQLLTEKGFSGDYVGYDVAHELIEAASAKFPQARFEHRDIFTAGIGEEFDYALVSGVFNNQHSKADGYVAETLRLLFRHVRAGLAFNALSTYVEYFDEHLNYLDPLSVFEFCKTQLSACSALRHDYLLKEGIIPYEFSIYVYKKNLPLPADRAAVNQSGKSVNADRV